ncbi:flagellin B, partial [Campylobacter pinnipediorum]|uniref:flagellin B n=1 Tax=Campylobacter pinnipediorum TaxID=1965231 RepID=UPI00112F8535
MSFRINTNVNAMNSHANAVGNNRNLANSLGRLSSGLRIQTAADDASGLAIADSLRSQASALGQAIANGNDAIGIIQVADKAMDEQLKILDTIKVKATQAAQDGQTTRSRQALQADIVRLMEELDNIGNSTSFNGQQLLNGTFSNKEFQIGAYSNQTVKASIGATTSDKIGLTRFESSKLITAASGKVSLTFINVDGINNVKVAATELSYGLGKGIGALAENINKVADQSGVRATFDVTIIASKAITAGSIVSLNINGVKIGDLDVKDNDSNGTLVNAINTVKDQTGVEASIDPQGKLVLTSRDGRAIKISGGANGDKAIGKRLGVSDKISLS